MGLLEFQPDKLRQYRKFITRVPELIDEQLRRPASAMLFIFGRFSAIRGLARYAAGRARPTLVPPTSEAGGGLSSLEVAEVVARLRQDGLCTGLKLPEETVARIRDYAETHLCYGGPRWNTPVEPWDHAGSEARHGEKLLVANFPDCDRDCTAVAELIRNPWLHRIAAGYLGARPELIDVRLWWTFPATGASHSQLSRVALDTFHFDLADWQQLKFFFYITDVDMESGSHVYARRSHARRPLADQLKPFYSRSRTAVAALHGAAAIEAITGSAGTGFVEDPFGYHTGTTVQRGRRLILELSFGISRTARRRDYLSVS